MERLVYKPLDGALLMCRPWPTGDGVTDLDAISEANRGYDAWLDCWKKLEKIKELMAAPQ